MKNIDIKQIKLSNFKGIRSLTVPFNGETVIKGRNASGKTTIFDALTWVLFNKDSSGNEKFSLRPLNADGSPVDGVEIDVCVVLSVDEQIITLHKTQKQNWVKKRGSETAVFQGNANSYEVNGYPKTEADFKKTVADLIDEGLFKMLTNPLYFPNMPWKEQRQMLMEFAADETDAEIARRLGGFDELIPELEQAPSTEDIRAKYTKALKGFKERQKEIPVRIDELESTKEIVDLNALKEEKGEIVKAIVKCKEEEDEAARQMVALRKVKDEILDIKRKAMDIERKADDEIRDGKYAAEIENQKLEIKKRDTKQKLQEAQRQRDERMADLRVFQRQLDEQKNAVFSGQTACPLCGRKYSAEKMRKAEADFQRERSEKIEYLEWQISEQKDNIAKQTSEINRLIKDVNWLAELKPITSLATYPDYESIPEWVALKNRMSELQSELMKEDHIVWQIDNASMIRRSHEEKLAEVNQKIAKAEAAAKIDERIADLREELREVGQKVSDQEKMLYLLERFISNKLDFLSEQINGQFDGVEFQLFEKQINGGMKETCVCTVNGVPYGSVNSGHKIVAGLQIIKALQKRFGVLAPIFIDNAESINAVNIPAMQNQMILMFVTNGSLEVENG